MDAHMTAEATSDRWLLGDARERLRDLDAGSIHACVTSPPYFGLRDYGADGQIGLEPTPEAYIAELVGVFREVRRVLRNDGTLWLNLGDSYSHGGCGARDAERWPKQQRNDHMATHAKKRTGAKPKDLLGIPWMAAFALRADGWYLRADIVWSKPNPMPESVRDRPTKAHEYVFLLSKSKRYYYDAKAIAEPMVCGNHPRTVVDNGPEVTPPGTPPHRGLRTSGLSKQDGVGSRRYDGFNDRWDRKEASGDNPETRNKRSVWTVAPAQYDEAHFATMPEDLAEPCILAGSPVGGVVLDPFGGAGTTALVARRLGRRFVHAELNPDYLAIAQRRLADVNYQARLFA